MAKGKSKAKAEEFTGTTHIGLVVDRSTSMRFNLDESNAALAKWHAAVVAAPSADRTDLRIGFFDSKPDTVSKRIAVRATEAPLIDPRGSTALYDATLLMISKLAKSDDDDSRTLCVVITDGEENVSRAEWPEVKEAMAAKEATGRWTFVFLGAELTSKSSGGYLGMVGAGNASGRGIGYIGDHGAMATSSYLASSERSTKAFFDAGERPAEAPADADAVATSSDAVATPKTPSAK